MLNVWLAKVLVKTVLNVKKGYIGIKIYPVIVWKDTMTIKVTI